MAEVVRDLPQSSTKLDSGMSAPPSGVPPPTNVILGESINSSVPGSKIPTPSPKGASASPSDFSSRFSASGISNWAKGLRRSSSTLNQEAHPSDEPSKSAFSFISSSFGKRTLKIPIVDDTSESHTEVQRTVEGGLGNLTKGFFDSSKNAMKAVQIKARHLVSQNKRRYQEGGFDLDMTYITENVIAMGFPAGDMSSGLLGYVEGFYRNHMEEVIKFFETRHPGKYKVYNLCSERLYDAALFEGKVACFPFNDHNCPPLPSIMAFCQSAYAWLKGDLDNVVVVHCKAGMARTGLMICSLLLYLKFFPTAEETIAYYNQKRCTDGKALVLPSQLRYVKYFERVLRDFNGIIPGRRCILRGIRLHKCPYWVRPSITISDHEGVLFSTKKHPRTKDLMPEDFWFSAPRKGILVFALPGERCVADLNGDFKVHFQDRHGDFYCWLNTNMMDTRQFLTTAELDLFDKRRLPAPGFQVEIVVLDENVVQSSTEEAKTDARANGTLRSEQKQNPVLPAAQASESISTEYDSGDVERDDIFSDSEGEEGDKSRNHDRKSNDETRTDPIAPTENKLEKTGSSSNFDQSVTTRIDPGESHLVAIASGASWIQEHGSTLASLEGQETAAKFGSLDQVIPEHSQKDDGEQAAINFSEPSAPNQKSQAFTEEESKEDKTVVMSSDFKAIAAASAADASVFTFGDDEDFESEEE